MIDLSMTLFVLHDTYRIGIITKGCKKVVFEKSLNFTGRVL